MTIKLNLRQQLHLLTCNKDFFLFTLNEDNKVINYTVTSDLIRYKNKYDHFKVISCIKNEIINNTFNI